MDIQLITPHSKQYEVLDTILDQSVFCTVAVLGRQFGKTLLAENIAVYWALNDPGCTVFFVSPTDGQNLRIYRDIIDALWTSGCIKSKKQPKGGMEILFKNNSKILLKSAASEDSLRGQPVEYMILDEAAFIKRTTVDSILLPMLAVKGKKMYVSSTPKSKNWLYDWYLKGQSDPKWRSFRYSTHDSPYANPDLIQLFKETLPPKLYQQEIEAEFVDSASVFNNINEVMCLTKLKEPLEGDHYYAGVDIGIINDASVLTVMNQRNELVNYYRWEKTEAPELIEEIINLNIKWKFKKILIENNNQGLTIFHDIRRRINNVEEFNTNGKTKGEIINGLIHVFNMKTIKIVQDELLRIELEAFIFKQKDGRIKFEADSGFHDDIVMALAIVQECYEVYRNLKYDPKRVGMFTARQTFRERF
jgi:hypothetical protein